MFTEGFHISRIFCKKFMTTKRDVTRKHQKKSPVAPAAKKSIDPIYWGYSTDFSTAPACRGVKNVGNALGRLLVPYFFTIWTLWIPLKLKLHSNEAVVVIFANSTVPQPSPLLYLTRLCMLLPFPQNTTFFMDTVGIKLSKNE